MSLAKFAAYNPEELHKRIASIPFDKRRGMVSRLVDAASKAQQPETKHRIDNVAHSLQDHFKGIYAQGQAAGAAHDDLGSNIKKDLISGATKMAIPLGIAAVVGAGTMLSKIGKKKRGFDAMTSHAGADYHGMADGDKLRAAKLYDQLHKHSPTAAHDPLAAWNHVRYFMVHPQSYGPAAIEQLKKIEAKPSGGASSILGKK